MQITAKLHLTAEITADKDKLYLVTDVCNGHYKEQQESSMTTQSKNYTTEVQNNISRSKNIQLNKQKQITNTFSQQGSTSTIHLDGLSHLHVHSENWGLREMMDVQDTNSAFCFKNSLVVLFTFSVLKNLCTMELI